MNTHIEVAVELAGNTVTVGQAHLVIKRGRTSSSFTYDPAYLTRPGAYEIDPHLHFDSLQGFTDRLPGAFADTAPDRWGRRLIEKKIRGSSIGTPRTLTDVDYLMGVSDATRQGALRFRIPGQTDYQEAGHDVPKKIRLPELLHAADVVARDGNDADDLEAVKVLLNAGSGTLGGARPKASILSDDNTLYIAKFPHHNDEWDVMAWEKTALDLAEHSGIPVPPRILTRVGGRNVLLLQRFDRHDGLRIGYMSAMTLIQGRDGNDYDYEHLGEELMDVSAAADDDLAQLWRRIAFSVAIHNTDDHMRNHGLLHREDGWNLSPLFDVNPNPNLSEHRATSICAATARDEELDGLTELAKSWGLGQRDQERIWAQVSSAVNGWRYAAKKNGISDLEISRFTGAFTTRRLT